MACSFGYHGSGKMSLLDPERPASLLQGVLGQCGLAGRVGATSCPADVREAFDGGLA